MGNQEKIDTGFYGTLMTYALHQNGLMWSRTQLLTAVQAAILSASYVVRDTPWLNAGILLLGVVLTVGVLLLVYKDVKLREVNEQLMKVLAERMIPKSIKDELERGGAPSSVRFTLGPKDGWRWTLIRGRYILYAAMILFIVIDEIMLTAYLRGWVHPAL